MLSSSADQLSLPLPYLDEEFQGPFSTSHLDLESTQQESSHSQSQTKTTSGFPLPASSSTVLTGSLSHLEHLSLAELETLIDLKVGVIYFALFPLKLDRDEGRGAGGRSLPFLRGAWFSYLSLCSLTFSLKHFRFYPLKIIQSNPILSLCS
jgi:hypothetical protein